MWDWFPAASASLCLLTEPSIYWLRNASDLLIGAAYAMIPFGLASFLSARRDIEFGWLAWLFALFIALCGAPHWLERIVARGIARGEVRPGPAADLPLMLVAPAIMAAIWRMTFDRHAHISADAFLRAHIDLVFNGLLTPERNESRS